MKKQFLSIVCLTALSGASLALASAPQPSPSPSSSPAQAGTESASGLPSPEEIMVKLDAKLALTPDQKREIRPILIDRMEKLKALKEDTSMRKLKKARMAKSIMSESDEKIEGILTGNQMKIFKEMEEEMHEEIRAKMDQ